ncbi:MAG: hypothetical protein GWO81_02800 [Verrucomicrobia bacterium]|nr:hypothetical protein [Verrucomicrobiota bacterium]
MMETFIQQLQSGNWIAWAGLLVAMLLVLIFSFKCIVKIGKIFFILLILGAVFYGLIKLFPEQAAPLMEKIEAFWPEAEETEPLVE